MRLIDANALMAYFEEQYNLAMDDPDPVSGYVMSALRCCTEHFKTIPTVDALPVVRCKDCKNISPSVTPMRETVWCREFRAYMPCDGFCSYGERMVNNGTD